jgi:glutamate--cysteine ligase
MAGQSEMTLETASGMFVKVYPARERASKADLVLSNNDFSKEYDFLAAMKNKIHPPYDQGWHRRKKSTFFHNYNKLMVEFAKVIDMDPWKFSVLTEEFEGFDVESEDSRKKLATKVDEVLAKISDEYSKRNITDKPFVVIKNNSGTYGLGVIMVRSGQEVIDWTYKARKKMKATKGGGGITDVIVQEGITSVIKTEQGETAEPVIYMIGSNPSGGFLRANSEKGADENLNAPGSVYKKLCLSDLLVDYSKVPMENVYGWVCKVAAMAVAQELA